MRGLSVSVYRNAEIGDCTNGGVTATAKSLFLFDIPDGNWSVEDMAARPNAILLVKRDKAHYRGYVYAVPAMVLDGTIVEKPVPEGHVGWMNGGNLVGTCDSRFAESITTLGAIPVHDRSENYAQYRALSV